MKLVQMHVTLVSVGPGRSQREAPLRQAGDSTFGKRKLLFAASQSGAGETSPPLARARLFITVTLVRDRSPTY